jgi:hypothetical protein
MRLDNHGEHVYSHALIEIGDYVPEFRRWELSSSDLGSNPLAKELLRTRQGISLPGTACGLWTLRAEKAAPLLSRQAKIKLSRHGFSFPPADEGLLNADNHHEE